jgi:cytochrome c553
MTATLWMTVALLCGATGARTFHESVACLQCHAGSKSARPDDEVKLCLRCHDGSSVGPDVLHGAAGPYSFTGDGGRSAGSLSVAGDGAGGQSGWSEHSGHTLGSTLPPPGFAGTWTGGPLRCSSCHAVHANGNYRNLGPDPLLSDPDYVWRADRLFPPEAQPSFAFVPPGTPLDGVAADVLVVEGRPPYDANSVVFSTNRGRNAMNRFCATCHADFHGEGNTRAWHGLAWRRHPTSGVVIAGDTGVGFAQASSPPRVNWREDGTAEVACLTCHRAHGTTRPFGLVYWDPSVAVNGEDGAAPAMEALCGSCHAIEARAPVTTFPSRIPIGTP